MDQEVQKFLWLDMEMTGLDPEKEVIIEVACVVTDWHCQELDSYHQIVKQHSDYLQKMDRWNTRQHKKSGLYEQVANGITQDQMERELIDLADKHFQKDERVVLAGNSIYQDRIFIKKHLLRFEQRLHYRMLDVSSWKIIFANHGLVFEKENKHRALDDVRESIREIKTYLNYVNYSKLKAYKNI